MKRGMVRWQVVRAALLAGVALLIAQTVAHLIATMKFGVCASTVFGPCQSVFDVDRSNGISDVVSTFIIVAAAFGATVLGIRRIPGGAIEFGLAAALLLVAAEDTLHVDESATSLNGLALMGTVLLVAVLAGLVALGSPPYVRLCLVVGVALLAVDAKTPFVYDQLMNLIGEPALHRGDLLYELGIVLDEGMELMGWVLVAVGLWEAALVAAEPISVDPPGAAIPTPAQAQD